MVVIQIIENYYHRRNAPRVCAAVERQANACGGDGRKLRLISHAALFIIINQSVEKLNATHRYRII